MELTSCLRRNVRPIIAALVLLAAAVEASGFDIYVAQDGLLTMPAVVVGNETFTEMTVSVGALVVRPSGFSPDGASDNYNPSTRQLTVQAVQVGSTMVYNAVVSVTDLVGVATVSGADSYSGGQLMVPAVRVGDTVYTDVLLAVTPTNIVSVARGMPAALLDTYDAASGHLTIPAVLAGAHAFTNVTLNVKPSDVLSVGGHRPYGTGVLSLGFNSNGTTTTAGATGTWAAYFDGSNSALVGSSGGDYADQSMYPSDEYVSVNDTLANLGAYTHQGVAIKPGSDQVVRSAGFNALSFSLYVNPEWFQAGANFVVMITSKVPGVSLSSCDPQVAAVVTATGSAAIPYTVPLARFDFVSQACGTTTVTPAQILAGTITRIDFQADGLGAAVTASGLTSNSNTTNAVRGTYATTVKVLGEVAFTAIP